MVPLEAAEILPLPGSIAPRQIVGLLDERLAEPLQQPVCPLESTG
jgi:hypothetical protein